MRILFHKIFNPVRPGFLSVSFGRGGGGEGMGSDYKELCNLRLD